MKIKKVVARQVLDSRGNPTLEVSVFTAKSFGEVVVPSGMSTGKYEAKELRDNKKEYFGRGVLRAVRNVNEIIARKIIGMDAEKQEELDYFLCELDGTEDKSKLGANAILGVSLAAARNFRGELYKKFGKNFVLPVPYCNVINGGLHSGSNLKFQEFMLVPVGAKSFSEATRITVESYFTLRDILIKRFGKFAVNVGDEGGFVPPIKKPEEALELLEKAVEKAGYGNKIKYGVDVAASNLYYKGKYNVGKKLRRKKLINYYLKLIKNYPIIMIEDPFGEEDYESWKMFRGKVKIDIFGDDLLTTNIERMNFAMMNNLCNGLILKMNQIGTLSEALDAGRFAMKHNWKVIVSHRSGESCDDFISDLAVGLGCGKIKLGAPCRGERIAKFNRLLEIEEQLGKKAKYGGAYFGKGR